MDNIIAINKPVGPTSHDIVDEVRKITRERRVGHAGTLDPLASGVLVVGIGRQATRQLSQIVKGKKEYKAEIILGKTSTTDDAEGEKTDVSEKAPDKSKILKILQDFVGRIEQVPPAYSAIKQKGVRAYSLARAGVKVKLAPRIVTVEKVELISYNWPTLKILVVCGPGVYIRSLARDIGKLLGCGGYLSALERTVVGGFTLKDAKTVEEFAKEFKISNLPA